jgi:hypothetical protein
MVFDTSRKKNDETDKPIEFKLGAKQVIPCWDQNLDGLCKGAKASIVCPSQLAYGAEGSPGANIPGFATLHFEVRARAALGPHACSMQPACVSSPPASSQFEIMGMKGKGAPKPNIFKMIDADGSKDITKEEIDAHFAKKGKPAPPAMFASMDANGDGIIAWEEFKGEKGRSKDEL